MNALKFGISILSLAALCLAHGGLTIDNKHQERVSAPEVGKVYSSACSVATRNSTKGIRSIPRSDLFWVPREPRYGFRDEKSDLPSGTVTRSHRESCGWFLRI
jgi:hypothetical protein